MNTEISPSAVAFGRLIGRLDPERPLLAKVAVDLLQAMEEGHGCLDVADLGAEEQAALASPTVGGGQGSHPLVVRAGRLYLARMERMERAVAARLLRGASEPEGAVDEGRLDALIRRMFAGTWANPEQEVVVRAAVRQRLVVLAGGPGTGKTTTVVRMLAALVDQALAAGRPAPRALLLAPTGKAAARLASSVRSQVEGLAAAGVDGAVLGALPKEAFTLHRALQSEAGWRSAFRRGPERPWAEDVVVVDELSMVDLPLLAATLGALAPGARLVLIGDPDQLASVGPGAVLADLCAAGGAIARVRHRLRTSRRFDAGGPIAALAVAVLRGDEEAVLAAFDGRVARLESPTAAELVRRAAEAWGAFCVAAGEARLAAMERFRVLCALRQGPMGADALTAAIEAELVGQRRLAGGRFYDGRPIMITANDASVGLQNGDAGVIVRTPQGLRALFPGEGRSVRQVLPGRLPPHETAFATTVHKSQGSEFEQVMLVLGDQPSPLLVRELLYTGLTRAKEGVVVCGDRERLLEAVRTRMVRRSGLVEALGMVGTMQGDAPWIFCSR